MKKSIYLLIILIFLLNINPSYGVTGKGLIFMDSTNINPENKLIVYENGSYLGIYNYSEFIDIKDNEHYVIIIDEDYIDIINDESFFKSLFSRYGIIIISLIIVFALLGLLVYVYKTTKG